MSVSRSGHSHLRWIAFVDQLLDSEVAALDGLLNKEMEITRDDQGFLKGWKITKTFLIAICFAVATLVMNGGSKIRWVFADGDTKERLDRTITMRTQQRKKVIEWAIENVFEIKNCQEILVTDIDKGQLLVAVNESGLHHIKSQQLTKYFHKVDSPLSRPSASPPPCTYDHGIFDKED